MKLKSEFWKDRKINMPNRNGVSFDSNGIADVEVNEDEAKQLCANIIGLSFFEVEEPTKPNKSAVIDGDPNVSLENQDEIDENKENLDFNKASEEEMAMKNESIDQINKIVKLSTLRKLASEFDKEEWSNLSTVDEFKRYLISKI